MWLKNQLGDLINLDNGAMIILEKGRSGEYEVNYLPVFVLPVDIEIDHITENFVKGDKTPFSRINIENDFVKRECADFFKTFLASFRTIEQAQKYLEKLTEKLNAEEIKIDED